MGTATCSDVVDNDCDGLTDLTDPNCQASCVDNDSDGYGNPGDPTCPSGGATDCNDTDNKVYPGAPKICDGKDNNCDGRLDFSTDVDVDGDGYAKCAPGECNDNDPAVNAGAQEGPFGHISCSDGIDNNCNYIKDQAEPACGDPCLDMDGDGYGANGDPSCPNGPAIDCNDGNATINPGASDANCNNIDDNCSGQKDEDYVETPTSCGVGVCASAGVLQCLAGGILNDTCLPGSPAVEGLSNPPSCSDVLDNDCDGLTDGADPSCVENCVDGDGDGYGVVDHPLCQFSGDDCNDTNPNIHPGAADNTCNGIDVELGIARQRTHRAVA
jgi:hypothetical protein